MNRLTPTHDCQGCAHKFGKVSFTDHSDDGPKLGDVLVCPDCFTVNQVRITGTVKLSEEDVMRFPDEVKKEILFVLRTYKSRPKTQ